LWTLLLIKEDAMTRNILARIIKDESGATAIEYGLIVALVSMAAITAYSALGGELKGFFTSVKDTLSANKPTSGAGGGAGGGGGSGT
jgi:pilus assembly protein Flp/PilA